MTYVRSISRLRARPAQLVGSLLAAASLTIALVLSLRALVADRGGLISPVELAQPDATLLSWVRSNGIAPAAMAVAGILGWAGAIAALCTFPRRIRGWQLYGLACLAAGPVLVSIAIDPLRWVDALETAPPTVWMAVSWTATVIMFAPVITNAAVMYAATQRRIDWRAAALISWAVLVVQWTIIWGSVGGLVLLVLVGIWPVLWLTGLVLLWVRTYRERHPLILGLLLASPAFSFLPELMIAIAQGLAGILVGPSSEPWEPELPDGYLVFSYIAVPLATVPVASLLVWAFIHRLAYWKRALLGMLLLAVLVETYAIAGLVCALFGGADRPALCRIL
jgi:hypothetical protein